MENRIDRISPRPVPEPIAPVQREQRVDRREHDRERDREEQERRRRKRGPEQPPPPPDDGLPHVDVRV